MPVAVVTGGSRGIGAATAPRLARLGFDVCLSYRTEAGQAAEVVAACEAEGVRAQAVQADAASEDDLVALFEAAAALGPIGAVVVNIGATAPYARVDELDLERLQRTFAVNVVSAFVTCREAVRRMSTAHGGEGGAIVLNSSAASRLGSPNEYVDYAASKGALDSLTLGLSKEVAREGVRVNAVRPGLIHTELHVSSGVPDRVARLEGTIPMGRGGTADEVAAAIAWLCSSEASYVTGALLDVSGGR
jgi:NAD(P)-dependent dehydrogenase (short-subunit alcohol dehydrogenase family)